MERLERTDVAQADFEAHMRNQRQRVVSHIMQQVIAENPYKPDMEWQVWYEAQQREEHNHLPHGVTADEVYQEYLRTWCGE